jgi:uncharacterized protein
LYIDPRNEKVFYVGKGEKNRAFSHLSEISEQEKVRVIKEIQSEGKEPRIEILIHGIEDDFTAKKIESSVIDLIGKEKLTNIQRGYESRDFGRMGLEQVMAMYQSEKVQISEQSILININTSFRYGMSSIELYDATRSAWVVGDRREIPVFAFAVYSGIVQEIYRIVQWFPSNSTLNSRREISEEPGLDSRWEFVGNLAEGKIRKKYIYKDVSEYMGPRNPINYVNCES